MSIHEPVCMEGALPAPPRIPVHTYPLALSAPRGAMRASHSCAADDAMDRVTAAIVPTPVPVPPGADDDEPSRLNAMPAMSMWVHSAPSANSLRNAAAVRAPAPADRDRKSTRLNSS